MPEVPAVPGTGLRAAAEAVFADDGPLARELPHFEPRQGQRALAGAVADTLEQGGVLLAEAGTGFREVRESALRDRAMLLLSDATLSLESIASSLGYSDLANFSHAFKRWTDMSPGSFRRNGVPVLG